MSSFDEEEVLRSGISGVFRLHSLILKIESLNELSPELADIEDEPALPLVVALHVHEYIHYLHNLTTRAGLGCLTDILLLVQPLQAQKVDDSMGFGADDKRGVQLRATFDSLRNLKGYVKHIPPNYKWRRVMRWEFSEVSPSQSLVPAVVIDPEQQVEFYVTAFFDDDTELQFTFSPGLDFITEGIAYEIERDIRIRAGVAESEADTHTPGFPYLAFGPLLEFLAGCEVPADQRVVLGTLALLAPSPSVALTSLSQLQRYEEGTSGAVMFTAIVNDILDGFENYSGLFRDRHIPMFYKIFEGSELLSKGLQVYEKLLLKGLDVRRQRQFLELAFLREPMTIKNFKNIAANLLERVVFQGKPGGELEIRWEGAEGSVVDLPADMREAFAVLQSCIHYVQQHLKDTRFETQEPLRPTPCPFSGACTVESMAGKPEVCRSTPWEVENIAQDGTVCIYQAGVDSFKSILPPQPALQDDSLPI